MASVNKVRKRLADGTVAVYHYHRASGAKLPGEPGSPAFIKALCEAEAKVQQRAQGEGDTLASLIRRFCNSADWRKLADSTRSVAAFNLKAVEDKWGKVPLAAFGDRRIRAKVLEWRDEIAIEHPRAADAKVSIMARVLSWGLDRALVTDNPLSECGRSTRAVAWIKSGSPTMCTSSPRPRARRSGSPSCSRSRRASGRVTCCG